MLEVAAAVLQRDDGSFLLARRPEGKVYAGYWEFPGGKIETGEAAETALARELYEELGIGMPRMYPWITRVFAYPHATVRLNFFRVLGWTGEPHARERQQIHWQRLDGPIPEPMLPANAPVLAALALPYEYAVTDAHALGGNAMLAALERRLAGGLRLIQVRDKDMAPDDRMRFARGALALARRYGARLLVNSDLSLARELGADGVHFSARQMMSLANRPRDIMAAASCHDVRELARAMTLGLDFAVLGPVKPTASHPLAVPMGWRRFAELARGASLPVYAIGGLRLADLEDAWRAGAHGVAMLSGSWH
ncbi:MAG: Nudix family hydrolase [Sphingomonadaceae bacterium]